MTDVRLSWADAEVDDGEPTVELEGEIPKGWKGAFAKPDRLLGGGRWSEVRVRKQTVRILGVTPDSEEKLG